MENNKQVLRKTAKQALKNLSKTELEKINHQFIAKICQFLVQNQFKKIGIYVSFGLEAPTHSIIEFALEKKLKVYVPKVIDQETMEFYELKSLNELKKTEQFDFLQPVVDPKKLLKKANDLDVLFIPLTVFDSELNRIGTGYGFYDRWITNNHFQGLKVGLARQVSYTKELIETNEFDVKLDYVITESQVYGW